MEARPYAFGEEMVDTVLRGAHVPGATGSPATPSR
jgi:hypothetical protein